LFYDDPIGHDIKSFAKRILFGNERVIEAKNRLIAKGDEWAKKVTQNHLVKQNKFMDDTYDWHGRNPLMSNDTTYGQIDNNFTAGVVGSTYKITNPKYIAANAYSAAVHPLQTLDRININGWDVLNGVMDIADKVRNKEYGALVRGAGYVAGNVAQAYLLSNGIEKCGDLLDKKRGETLLLHPPVDEGGLDTIIKNGKVSIDDIKTNPSAFSGKSAEEIADVLRNSGYDVTIKNSTRSRSGAQIIQINKPGGGKNISQVQVSPGGGRHGSNPYVKISTTDQGIIKIVDGIESTYKTDGKETATIIFSGGN
jgi:hypothetical protein